MNGRGAPGTELLARWVVALVGPHKWARAPSKGGSHDGHTRPWSTASSPRSSRLRPYSRRWPRSTLRRALPQAAHVASSGSEPTARTGTPVPSTARGSSRTFRVRHARSPATRTCSSTGVRAGASATFLSSYSDVASGSKPCPMSAVAQITAPDAAASLFIPAELGPCRGVVNVSAVRAGVHHA